MNLAFEYAEVMELWSYGGIGGNVAYKGMSEFPYDIKLQIRELSGKVWSLE